MEGSQARISQALLAPLPEWARPSNPMLRFVLQGIQQRGTVLRWLLRIGIVLMLLSLLAISFWFYDDNNPLGMADAVDSAVFTVLYLPLVALQAVALLLAFFVTANRVGLERQRGRWEALKITSHGAEMVVRAQWAATFYQLRWLLVLLLVPRLLFTGLLLIDLGDNQGYTLDLYVTGITPDVPLEVAILLLAALMTVALMQIPVLVGLNSAIGLLLAVSTNNRTLALIVRVVVVLAEMALVALALGAGQDVLDRTLWTYAFPAADTTGDWFKLLFFGALGDQSLRFMNLGTFLRTWSDVDYAVTLGGALLAILGIEVVLTNRLLVIATRRASRPSGD